MQVELAGHSSELLHVSVKSRFGGGLSRCHGEAVASLFDLRAKARGSVVGQKAGG